MEVLPFHQMGKNKWKALEIPYPLEHTMPPSDELVDAGAGDVPVARTAHVLTAQPGCRKHPKRLYSGPLQERRRVGERRARTPEGAMTLSADDRPGDEPGGIAVDPDLPPPAVDPEVLDEQRGRWTPLRIALWVGVALLGGLAWVMIALVRGETVNAIWFVFAAVCTYFIAYRFYSTYIEKRITQPDDRRATPAEYNENGQDYMPMDRRVLYGHHFAAIAGAGPLVGPVLAAQWGYLPGTLWIIVGVVLAGAVQDYLVLFFSMRRGGRSLGQMAREELGLVGGVRRPDRHAADHDHHRGDPRPGGGERARREPVGRLLGRA